MILKVKARREGIRVLLDCYSVPHMRYYVISLLSRLISFGGV